MYGTAAEHQLEEAVSHLLSGQLFAICDVTLQEVPLTGVVVNHLHV
jgi:hypothetical protein